MNRIKELRNRTGLTQNRFAEYFHISIGTLKGWESERRIPPFYVMEMIERIISLEEKIQQLKKSQDDKVVE